MAGTREERRLVTCVFIDIVGSTSLTGQLGPERLKRALNEAFGRLSERIEAEGGVVEKYIGDAVYALFGAPVARADDPLRALRAAHACREWAALPDSPFAVRIGVETGEAVVDLEAVETTHQRMSVGPVVNTAARLEQAAAPGQVLVGPACYAATRTSAVFRPLGSLSLKGLDPTEVWELDSPGEAASAVDLPFVGRGGDLEVLRLALARSAQRAVFALVSGPPGQGKTRLVRELIAGSGRTPFVARFRPPGDAGTAAPMRELLGGTGADRAAVEQALASIADADERERVLRGVLHSADIEHDERLARLPDEERMDEVVHAWRRYFTAGTERAPIVWFEDLHWADESAVRLVDRLTLASGALFVIATARPEFAQAAGLRPGGDRFFIELGPLELEDAAELARTAGALGTEAVERAQGNPLFIVELARTSGTGRELPVTLQGALGARLDELAPAERELLSHAAVMGDTFRVDDAAYLSGRPAAEVAAALARLVDLLYLRREGGAYRFHHNLLRDVAYGRLLVADRMRIHARLAAERGASFDPETEAHHWWEAVRPPDDEWVWTAPERAGLRRSAATAHLAAARRHLDRHDARRALAMLARAEQLTDTEAERAGIDRAWGRAAAIDGKGDEAWERSARAVAYHRRTGTVPPELYFDWLHVPVWFSGFFERAPKPEELRALIDEGQAAADSEGDAASLARLRMLRGMLDGDLAATEAAVADAARVLAPAGLAPLLSELAQMQFEHGDLAAMAGSAERLRALSDAIADPQVAFTAVRRVAVWTGDLATARRLAGELERATRSAGPHIRSHALATLAWQAEAEGTWPEARRLAAEMTGLAGANEGTKFCALAGNVLAIGAVAEAREGRLDEARALLQRARPTVSQPGGWWPAALAVVGDRSPLANPPKDRSPHGWSGHALACVILGDRERALHAAERLAEIGSRGAWLAGATAEAIRDELAGAGPDAPGHARLRAKGYAGTSDLLRMRAAGG